MTTNEAPAFAVADLAKSYQLGLAELEKLRAALAPAFALGLQQAMESPARWPELARLFGAGPFAPGQANAGAGLVDLFFPSTALRDAVSRQAAAMTGLAAPVVAEMMPRLAALGAEAMMRGAMAQILPRPVAAAGALPADDLGRITAEMMRRGANAVEALSTPAAAPRASASPLSPFFVFDAFGEAMRATLGGAALAPASTPARPNKDFDPQTPFAAMFDAFAKGMRSAAVATELSGASFPPAAKRPADAAADGPARPDPDLMDAFVQSGRRLQDSYVREMTALFARFSAGNRGGGTAD